MAADQGIRIAEDGTSEVSMTEARANLTRLIREVRYGGRPAAFTERGARSAYVVPPEFYEQALRDRAIIDELHRRTQTPGAGADSYDEVKSRTIREALGSAAFAVDNS
ncbi:type II toxin-antitoxin system Phd/YefM family antitoxin [Streptomyces sp. NEAU-Y11]|uniref:type II toxin-antitoxin system Phd/YefM family antitoxin n=1 Tax=Streptomyces cucumeris TaxID=2962890 RepID=UPI0020C8FF9B|nr:type II toxin-antitoxin system Phd/YefM family antitoxin [Streptomyces sp. NEAU-Y11]MCP9205541.1 type II toxin-antitoxin system Phd/YefM family antitoxin [Streptomyces sp. NEAU-Y11]